MRHLNKKIDIIVDILVKPEKTLVKILQMGGMIVTLMTIFSVIDTIRQWLGF